MTQPSSQKRNVMNERHLRPLRPSNRRRLAGRWASNRHGFPSQIAFTDSAHQEPISLKRILTDWPGFPPEKGIPFPGEPEFNPHRRKRILHLFFFIIHSFFFSLPGNPRPVNQVPIKANPKAWEIKHDNDRKPAAIKQKPQPATLPSNCNA